MNHERDQEMGLTFTAQPTTSPLPPLGDYAGKLVKLEQQAPRKDNFNPGQHQVQVKFVLETKKVLSVVNADDEDAAFAFVDNDEECWAYANAAYIKDEDLEAYQDGDTSVAHPIFGKRSTLRKWFEAIIGRAIEVDETVSEKDVLNASVFWTVELNDNGNPTIKTIRAYRPARRRQRQEPDEFEGEIVDEDEDEDDF